MCLISRFYHHPASGSFGNLVLVGPSVIWILNSSHRREHHPGWTNHSTFIPGYCSATSVYPKLRQLEYISTCFFQKKLNIRSLSAEDTKLWKYESKVIHGLLDIQAEVEVRSACPSPQVYGKEFKRTTWMS